jgi:hypothetical protein
MSMIGNNRLLVYGGQAFDPETKLPTTCSDVHVFNVEKQKWVPVMTCDDKSRQWPRQWHTATFLPQRQLLICFGGETINPKTGRNTTPDKNNLMALDTEIMLWYPPSVTGEVPSGRSGHTATLLPSSTNNEMVIFGGVKNSKHLNSVSVLDTSRWVWSTPKVAGSPPKPRSYHSAIAIQASQAQDHHSGHVTDNTSPYNMVSRIVIFGGNDVCSSFNTVHVLEKTEGPWFHGGGSTLLLGVFRRKQGRGIPLHCWKIKRLFVSMVDGIRAQTKKMPKTKTLMKKKRLSSRIPSCWIPKRGHGKRPYSSVCRAFNGFR